MTNAKEALEALLGEMTDLRVKDRVAIVLAAAKAGLLSAGTHTTPNGTVKALAPEGAAIWELREAENDERAGLVIRVYSSYERALSGADERAGRFAEGAGEWIGRGITFAYENHPAEYVRGVPGVGVQRIRPTFLDR